MRSTSARAGRCLRNCAASLRRSTNPTLPASGWRSKRRSARWKPNSARRVRRSRRALAAEDAPRRARARGGARACAGTRRRVPRRACRAARPNPASPEAEHQEEARRPSAVSGSSSRRREQLRLGPMHRRRAGRCRRCPPVRQCRRNAKRGDARARRRPIRPRNRRHRVIRCAGRNAVRSPMPASRISETWFPSPTSGGAPPRAARSTREASCAARRPRNARRRNPIGSTSRCSSRTRRPSAPP